MQNATSISLLYRVRDHNDAVSWKEFTELYCGFVRHWLRGQGVQAEDADDITQEVMSCVCREIGNFEHNGRTGAFRHWLRRVMTNRLREFWKARRRQRGEPDLGELADQMADGRSGISRVWRIETARSDRSSLISRAAARVMQPCLLPTSSNDIGNRGCCCAWAASWC